MNSKVENSKLELSLLSDKNLITFLRIFSGVALPLSTFSIDNIKNRNEKFKSHLFHKIIGSEGPGTSLLTHIYDYLQECTDPLIVVSSDKLYLVYYILTVLQTLKRGRLILVNENLTETDINYIQNDLENFGIMIDEFTVIHNDPLKFLPNIIFDEIDLCILDEVVDHVQNYELVAQFLLQKMALNSRLIIPEVTYADELRFQPNYTKNFLKDHLVFFQENILGSFHSECFAKKGHI